MARQIGLKFSEVVIGTIVDHYSVLANLGKTRKLENSTLWLT